MSHVHITEDGKVVGTLSLDANGLVQDDGSPAAIGAMDHMNHKHKREHGQKALDAIVKYLDSTTMLGAHHCSYDHGHAKADEPSSTEPTPVNNPQDRWPDFGADGPKHRDVQFSGDTSGLN